MASEPSVKATWRLVADSEALKRSSQTLFATPEDLVVFSGELEPRKPVDNKLYHVPLNTNTNNNEAQISTMNPTGVPSPRVGAATATLNGKVYLFSGRGGEAMAPLEEEGKLWVFDQSKLRWSSVSPPPSSSAGEYPQSRSYHAMTSDGSNKIFLHAGCPASGRLSDLWSFSVSAGKWTKLSDAPAPARGGASVAFAEGRVWRMGGFDGEREQGLALDVYDIERDEWSTPVTWAAGEGTEGPSPRSVGALLPVTVSGRQLLVTIFGESDPSNAGHMGAGKMLGDVWAFEIAESKWQRVETAVKGGGESPAPRGWFAATAVPGKANKVVVQGGLGEDNERLGDVWVLEFE